jgi:indolepyruvate ferredoxin oxidoreductase beta subunit
MKSYNLLVTGVGGQGTVVASDVLAAVGLAAGYDVKKSDVLGLAVRGGSVISHVRWGERVHSPIVPEGQVDVLLAFEYLEGLRWLDQLRPEGTILVNRQQIYPVVVSSGLAEYPKIAETHAAMRRAARDVYAVPGLEIAQELGNPRVLNVVLLGALSGLTEITPETWAGVIRQRVPARAVELNVQAFWRGREALNWSRLGDEVETEAVL